MKNAKKVILNCSCPRKLSQRQVRLSWCGFFSLHQSVQIEINRGPIVWFSKDLYLTLVLNWNFNSSMSCWKLWKIIMDRGRWTALRWNLLGTSSHRTDVTQAAEKELLSLSYLPALFVTISPLSAPGYQPENLQLQDNKVDRKETAVSVFECSYTNTHSCLFPPDTFPTGIWSTYHRIHIRWDKFTRCLQAFLKVIWK